MQHRDSISFFCKHVTDERLSTIYMLHINRTDTNHLINNNKENSRQRIYFSICDACFWCASCIDIEKMAATNTKYPCCDNLRLELTYITSNNSILEL
jgi:hypothetical protein